MTATAGGPACPRQPPWRLIIGLSGALAAAWFLATGELLPRTLQHPADWPHYLTIARLASSIATVGGALGSGLQRRSSRPHCRLRLPPTERRDQARTSD